MIIKVIGWMLFGLIAGTIARLLHPGPDRMGMGATMILGILGSLVGGGIAFGLRMGFSAYHPGGWFLSVLGAILLLWMGYVGARAHAPY